jgi:hypothetical protein
VACECEADNAACQCIFAAGLNVTITGGGTPADPIVVNVDSESLIGVNGLNTLVTVIGNGDIQNPYIIRIEVDPAIMDGYWTHWVGSRSQLNTIGGSQPGVLAVVIPGA